MNRIDFRVPVDAWAFAAFVLCALGTLATVVLALAVLFKPACPSCRDAQPRPALVSAAQGAPVGALPNGGNAR